jgi:hypothetical protein
MVAGMFILFSLFLSFSSPAQAESKFICSALMGRSFYQELKPMRVSDKTKHCALSCYLALRCGSLESFHVGVIKEIMDLFGAGQAEWADLRANQQGITLARARRAKNQTQCLNECKLIYE